MSSSSSEKPSSIPKAEEFDTTDSPLRYLAFLGRLRPLLLPATRYLAYSSDVGEAFRPVAHPNLVRSAYGISWLYLSGDVAYEGYKTHLAYQSTPKLPGVELPSENADVALSVIRRAVFQGVASMGLPALTIHTAVKQSSKYFKKSANPKIRAWGPTSVGLSIVPFLPFMFDHPCEVAVDTAFDWIEEKTLGPQIAEHNRNRRQYHREHVHDKAKAHSDKKTEL